MRQYKLGWPNLSLAPGRYRSQTEKAQVTFKKNLLLSIYLFIYLFNVFFFRLWVICFSKIIQKNWSWLNSEANRCIWVVLRRMIDSSHTPVAWMQFGWPYLECSWNQKWYEILSLHQETKESLGLLKNVESLKQCVSWQNLRVPLCWEVGGAFVLGLPHLLWQSSRERTTICSRGWPSLGLLCKLDISIGLDEMHPAVLRWPPSAFVKTFSIR